MAHDRFQRGLTLIELIIFIIIVSVALAGVLTVLNMTTMHSADPMIRKQMLAIAEAILEEVQLQPFTWCDPDDPAAAAATGSASCTSGAAGPNDESGATLGPETSSAANGVAELRTAGSTAPFDNVSDYNGLNPTTGISGYPMPTGFTASVSVAQSDLNGIASTDATASLLIIVTVSRGSESIVLQGYRTRHSPNMLP